MKISYFEGAHLILTKNVTEISDCGFLKKSSQVSIASISAF
jgi:hypothetical protein